MALPTASDNPFPSVLVTETAAASIGSPASGKQRLFVDTDHVLKYKNSSGTVSNVGASSGGVATDPIWDAAGDLVQGTGADTAARLAIGSSGKVPISNGTALAYAFPPGYEFDYVERTTALTVTPTTEGTAATWIDCNAVTYDGSTQIKIEAWADSVTATGGTAVPVLVDGSTAIGWLGEINTGAQVFYGVRFLTPSAGAHTYHVKWWKTGGTIIVTAGASGAGADMPAFVRQTKA